MAISKPSQQQIDQILDYFNKYGIELTPENGSKLPLDEPGHNNEEHKWSVNVVVLTSQGPRLAYYRHELNDYTVCEIMPFDVRLADVSKIQGAEMLSNKFLTDICKFNETYVQIVSSALN